MKKLNNDELEARFDEGEDMGDFMDATTSRVVKPLKVKRVNVDFPIHLLNEIDKEADYVGVPRQSILKLWIAERVEQNRQNRTLA